MKIKDNRKAYYDYEIVKKYEVGIVLEGWEVKSVKAGNLNMLGSFAYLKDGEVWIRGINVGNYSSAKKRDEAHRIRDRKLLLKKEEIRKLESFLKENRRVSLVPLEFFLDHNLIKVTLGLAKGKKQYEKKRRRKERT